MTENKKEKMTYKKALEYAISELPDAPADVMERLEALVASFEKKSESRKPAADKEENKALSAALLDYLRSLPEEDKRTVTDLIKEVPAVAGFSTSRVTSLLAPLVTEGQVVRVTDKRRSYYKAA